METVPLPQDIAYQMAHYQDSKVPKLLATGILCPVIAFTAVILRFTARRISQTPLKADDWTILGRCQIFTTLYNVLLFVFVHAGFGRYAILAKNVRLDVILGVSMESTYGVGLPIIKISYLLLLHRIFGFPDKKFSRKLLYTGVLILAYSIVRVIIIAIQYVTMPIIWSPPGTVKGFCIRVKPALLVSASMNVFTDLIMFGLPIKKLWALRIDSKQRFQLIAIFLLGGFVCIISIVRIFQVLEYSLADVTYNDVDFAIWSGIELAIATLSTCVPTRRPLFDCAFGRRSNSNFTPSSFLHASFLRNLSLRNAPGERQQPSLRPTDSARRLNFWRVGREESLSTHNKTQDKSVATVTVDEKDERSLEVLIPLNDLEPQRDKVMVKKEWDVDCC